MKEKLKIAEAQQLTALGFFFFYEHGKKYDVSQKIGDFVNIPIIDSLSDIL